MNPHPSHLKTQRTNHPPKGSRIASDPIRELDDINEIKWMLKDNPRNYLLFVLGINNGLRAGDLIKLKASQFRGVQEGDRIPIREQKTGKSQEIIINKPIREALERYFDHYKPNGDEYLFASRKGGHIEIHRVNKLVKGWCRDVGLTGNYGSHTLRKTFGYVMRRYHEVPWEMISRRLNHSSPASTRTYLGIQDEEANDIIMRYPI